MKRYCIIGNGVAAVGCIEGIRSQDPMGPITVISREQYPVYCRPLISYYLEGRTDLQKIHYRPAGFYPDNGCQVLYGRSALAIHPAARQIALDDGTKIDYDGLCVAAGSSPSVPGFPGLELVKDRYTFLTLDDALALERAVGPDSRVLILGSGLIGLKCAEGLKDRAGQVTICARSGQVLRRVLDETCARRVEEHLKANGIRLLLHQQPVRFEPHTAIMESGLREDFDVLVLALGVTPNTDLVAAAGGRTDRAIVTNERMETTLEAVYAAGDCAESYDPITGSSQVLAIWPNAYQQGWCAGVNMAGGQATFDHPMPLNSITLFDLSTMTAGSYYGPDQGGEVYAEESDQGVKRLYSKDGVLTGFMLVGDTDRTGIYTALIRDRVSLDTIDYDAIKKAPSLLPFGRVYRSNALGGVV